MFFIDYLDMIMLRWGYFETEEEALSFIDRTAAIHYQEYPDGVTLETIRSRYKVVPVYPHGDARISVTKYTRYACQR